MMFRFWLMFDMLLPLHLVYMFHLFGDVFSNTLNPTHRPIQLGSFVLCYRSVLAIPSAFFL